MLIREKTIQSLKDNQIKKYGEIKIQELPFVRNINLRFDPNNQDYMSLCSKILENIIPIKPNTYIKNEKLSIIWLGPNEWLIVSNDENDLCEKLNDQIGDLETSVTDVSENRTIIRVSGKKINILLSKFLVLDLEKNLSTTGLCAQTLFVKVPALLLRHNNNEVPEVDIFVNRSYSKYIYDLLVDGTKNLDF